MINKKVFLSLLTICCICVATAGTWASVSDPRNTGKISASAGKLVLTLDEGSTWKFSSTPLLPGESTTASFTLTNEGNRKGYLFITPVITDVPTGLVNDLKVEVVGTDQANNYLFTVQNAYANPVVIPVGEMYPAESYKITVTCSIPSSSTYNDGGSFTVSMDCRLNQRNKYDNT